jgi:hypothetical protein
MPLFCRGQGSYPDALTNRPDKREKDKGSLVIFLFKLQIMFEKWIKCAETGS